MSTKTRAKEILIDSDLSFNLNRLTNLAPAINPTDAVNLEQVLKLFQKLPVKDPVRLASNNDLPVSWSYDNGNDEWTGVSVGNTIDGGNIADADRILIQDDADPRGNGIWVLNGANNKLVRPDDANSVEELFSGILVAVKEGSANADKIFKLVSPDTDIVFGGSNIAFEEQPNLTIVFPQLSSSESITAVTSGNESPTGITLGSPINGEPIVTVNGRVQKVSYLDKTKPFYFSADGGATVQLVNDLSAGSELIWNGVVAGFELDNNDRIIVFNEN